MVSYGGADVGMLCADGRVSKLIFAFVSLDFIPLEPFFRQARQSGKLDVLEIDEGMMLQGLRAAAWRIPFIPTAVGLGTDIVEKTSEIKIINSPYDNKEWVAMPALELDAALIHVDHADCRGVCQISGPDHYMDDWFARAAQNTIVSCDELVSESFFNDENAARQVFWERAVTDAVVLIAGGAHPSSCAPLYGFDSEHFRSYAGFAKTDGIKGESFWIWLQLKVIADIGIIGMPNSGKSSLLSALTSARPKIANYPFTTTNPNLGVASYNDKEE